MTIGSRYGRLVVTDGWSPMTASIKTPLSAEDAQAMALHVYAGDNEGPLFADPIIDRIRLALIAVDVASRLGARLHDAELLSKSLAAVEELHAQEIGCPDCPEQDPRLAQPPCPFLEELRERISPPVASREER